MALSHSFSVRPLSPVAGAEVLGFDANNPISAAEFALIRQAWLDHGVLVFRDQAMTPESHERFSQKFGSLKGHILAQYLLPGHPFTLVLSNKKVNGVPVGLEDAGRYWHSDVSYEDLPPDGSLLCALEIPLTGGDTLLPYSSGGWFHAHRVSDMKASPVVVIYYYSEFEIKPAAPHSIIMS